MTDDDPVFTVTFECNNCGDTFDRDLPPRTTVTTARSLGGMVVRNEDCSSMGLINCECCYRVHCPTCDLYGNIRDVERSPLDGDDE